MKKKQLFFDVFHNFYFTLYKSIKEKMIFNKSLIIFLCLFFDILLFSSLISVDKYKQNLQK